MTWVSGPSRRWQAPASVASHGCCDFGSRAASGLQAGFVFRTVAQERGIRWSSSRPGSVRFCGVGVPPERCRPADLRMPSCLVLLHASSQCLVCGSGCMGTRPLGWWLVVCNPQRVCLLMGDGVFCAALSPEAWGLEAHLRGPAALCLILEVGLRATTGTLSLEDRGSPQASTCCAICPAPDTGRAVGCPSL